MDRSEKKTAGPRPLYLYALPPDLLDVLAVKDGPQQQDGRALDEREATPRSVPLDGAQGSLSCSLCDQVFAALDEQKNHVRSDWHRYNLRQRLRGGRPVAEAEFEKLIGDLDESLSGSDSDLDDEEDEEDRRGSALATLLRKQANLAPGVEANPSQSWDADEEDEAPYVGVKQKQAQAQQQQRSSPGSPLIYLTAPSLPPDTFYAVYKSVFTPAELEEPNAIPAAIRARQVPAILGPGAGSKKDKETIAALSSSSSSTPPAYKGPHMFLCMLGGGHFAAMVVALAPRHPPPPTVASANSAGSGAGGGAAATPGREAIVLAHKTFHRYTTRRKQGGAQSANDNAKGAAHSAGANLRRYNEQALTEDVRGLLAQWRPLIDSSALVVVRATGAGNRRVLFGPYDGQVLQARDARLRGFPFATRRPTQGELMRAFVELTKVKVVEVKPTPTADETQQQDESAAAAGGKKDSNKNKRDKAPQLTEEEETAQLHTAQVTALIRRSKLPALLAYLSANALSPDMRFFPEPHAADPASAPTPLHLAAQLDNAAVVTGLLVRAGADPTVANGAGRRPFELASGRAVRDAFRVARAELGEEKWDWAEAGGVGAPMSKEEAERRGREEGEKERARRKAEEERLRAEETPGKSAKAAGAGAGLGALGLGRGARERREEEQRDLGPEMRARLERERRARAAEERIRRMQAGG